MWASTVPTLDLSCLEVGEASLEKGIVVSTSPQTTALRGQNPDTIYSHDNSEQHLISVVRKAQLGDSE